MKKTIYYKAFAVLTAAFLLTTNLVAFAADSVPAEPKRVTGQTVADGSGSLSDTALTYKKVDGKDLAREDYSQEANPAIFNDRWTRGMYNALRQTVLDRDFIIPQNDESRFNPYYSYANAVAPDMDSKVAFTSVMSSISRRYYYYTDVEPYTEGLYNHLSYFIVTVKDQGFKVDQATEDAIAAVKDMSDRDKVISLNKYLQTRLVYDSKSAAGIKKVFTSSSPVKGACGTYAYAFQYLCERAGLPVVNIAGDNHGWTVVYVDGKWLHCDPTNSKKTNDGLLKETIRFKPYDSQRLLFAEEILVPGSTK